MCREEGSAVRRAQIADVDSIAGITIAAWDVDGGLPTASYLVIEDFPILVGQGSHSLRVVLDDGQAISESSEADNLYERSFTWIDGDPDLRLNPRYLSKTIVPHPLNSGVLDTL